MKFGAHLQRFRLGVCLRLLFMGAVLVVAAGCAYTLTGGSRVSAYEANHVGKNITLYGVMDFTGRFAPFIKTEDWPIYLVGEGSMPWKPKSQELQGKSVSVTGVLRWHAWTTKEPHRYFYFDAETAQIKAK